MRILPNIKGWTRIQQNLMGSVPFTTFNYKIPSLLYTTHHTRNNPYAINGGMCKKVLELGNNVMPS
jgi:hypothetical protein